ncbi:MAG: 4-alpha-glucanotransferase [Nitratireductor sp.]
MRVIAAPSKTPSVKAITGNERLWGINAAMYGLHSKRNPSFGDFEDLSKLSQSCASIGADFLGINPVHAIGWQSDEVISPYSPSHRCFLNNNHIALDQIKPVSENTRNQVEWGLDFTLT